MAKGVLPCGCGVRTGDAIWVYYKHYSYGPDTVKVEYTDWRFRAEINRRVTVEECNSEEAVYCYENVKAKFQDFIAPYKYGEKFQKILLLAFNNAVWGVSNYSTSLARCWHCKHNIGDQRLKCELGKAWLDLSCRDFVLSDAVFQKMLKEAVLNV